MEFAVVGEKSEFVEFKNLLHFYNKSNETFLSAVFYEQYDKFLFELTDKKFKLCFLVHSLNHNKISDLSIKIKQIVKNCKIVFCSESEKFAVIGYKLGFSHYVLLPLEYEEFEYVIKKFLKIEENIIIKQNWQKILIPIHEIMFAEKQGHNIIVHTPKKNYSTRTTFEKFASKLEKQKNFINCIRGTLVNLCWVSEIKGQNFIMKNNDNIPIRRQDRKKIKKMFFEFQLNKTTTQF